MRWQPPWLISVCGAMLVCGRPGAHHGRPTALRLKHYAGDVTYNVKGFLDKNVDSLIKDLKAAAYGSTNPVLKAIFPDGANITEAAKRPVTAGTGCAQGLTGGACGRRCCRARPHSRPALCAPPLIPLRGDGTWRTAGRQVQAVAGRARVQPHEQSAALRALRQAQQQKVVGHL